MTSGASSELYSYRVHWVPVVFVYIGAFITRALSFVSSFMIYAELGVKLTGLRGD